MSDITEVQNSLNIDFTGIYVLTIHKHPNAKDYNFWPDALKASDPRSDHVRYHRYAKLTKY